jgi:Lysine-specific metallo-endopeptidase
MSYDLMDVHDAKRKPRGRNRRGKQRGPCSCPQCLMAADLADRGFDIGDLSDTLMDMDDEDFNDKDLDVENCQDDFDDDDFDDEDFDAYDAKQRSQGRRRRRKSQRVPCSLMTADLKDDQDYDDEDDLDEFIAMDGEDDYDDEDDLDDQDYDDEDDLDGFIAMDGEDEDNLENFNDKEFQDDLDVFNDFDQGLDYRNPKFKGFTDDQKEDIIAALRLAEQFIAIGYDRMSNIDAAAEGTIRLLKRHRKRKNAWNAIGLGAKGKWTQSPARRWFGKYTRRRMKFTLRVLRRMKRAVQDRRLIFKPQQGKKAKTCLGTARWLGRRRIKICPKFFQKSLECQALIIVHELAHAVGIPGVNEKYTTDALQLKDWKKKWNADNYAYYCAAQWAHNIGRSEAFIQNLLEEPC